MKVSGPRVWPHTVAKETARAPDHVLFQFKLKGFNSSPSVEHYTDFDTFGVPIHNIHCNHSYSTEFILRN